MPTTLDDFNDGSTSGWTINNSTDITITESGGTLNFASDGSYSGSQNEATAVYNTNQNLSGKKIEVDIASTTGLGQFGAASSGMQLRLSDVGNLANAIYVSIDQNQLIITRYNNGSGSSKSFGNNGETKWRLEHDPTDNKWFFWTYDGTNWTVRAVMTPNWTPTSMQISFCGYIYGSNSTSRTSKFDNLVIDDSSPIVTDWTITESADITCNHFNDYIQFLTDSSYSGVSTYAEALYRTNYNFIGKRIEILVPYVNGLGQFSGASSYSQLYIYQNGAPSNYVTMEFNFNGVYMTRSNGGSLSQTNFTYVNTITHFKLDHDAYTNVWRFYTYSPSSWTLRFTAAAANWSPADCKLAIRSSIYGSNSQLKTGRMGGIGVGDSEQPRLILNRPSFQPFLAR